MSRAPKHPHAASEQAALSVDTGVCGRVARVVSTGLGQCVAGARLNGVHTSLAEAFAVVNLLALLLNTVTQGFAVSRKGLGILAGVQQAAACRAGHGERGGEV